MSNNTLGTADTHRQMLSNQPPPPEKHELWHHFSATYFSLRLGLVALSVAFPIVLYGWGKYVHGLPLQPSMSSYFFAAGVNQCAAFPMRTFFVGGLLAIAFALYCYKGLTKLENVLLNLAGLCAVIVAVVPERIDPKEALTDPRIKQLFADCPAVEVWATQPQALPYHYSAAVCLFILLAIVAWACACKSLDYLPVKAHIPVFKKLYRMIGILMVLFPVFGLIIAKVISGGGSEIFFIEWAGIWTFGAYWAVKSYELSLSRLERAPEVAVEHAT